MRTKNQVRRDVSKIAPANQAQKSGGGRGRAVKEAEMFPRLAEALAAWFMRGQKLGVTQMMVGFAREGAIIVEHPACKRLGGLLQEAYRACAALMRACDPSEKLAEARKRLAGFDKRAEYMATAFWRENLQAIVELPADYYGGALEPLAEDFAGLAELAEGNPHLQEQARLLRKLAAALWQIAELKEEILHRATPLDPRPIVAVSGKGAR